LPTSSRALQDAVANRDPDPELRGADLLERLGDGERGDR